jgi:hypothetical protein
MQTFYDKLFSSDTPADWKCQLTQVDLEELGTVIKATRGWQPWSETEEGE